LCKGKFSGEIVEELYLLQIAHFHLPKKILENYIIELCVGEIKGKIYFKCRKVHF